MNLKKLISLGLVANLFSFQNANSDENKQQPNNSEKINHLEFLCKENQEDYQELIQNYLLPRNVKVAVALDGVNESLAREIIDSLSYNYQKEFNISFKVIEYLNHHAEDSLLITDLEYAKIKALSKKRAEVYLLFTSKDWKESSLNEEEKKKYPLYGESISDSGFVWVETCHSRQKVLHTLIHEIAHFFGAEHEVLETIMNPSEFYDKIIWSNESRKAILENKFKE